MAIAIYRSSLLCFVLSGLALWGQSTPPKDCDGWSKAKWGMSAQEIQAAFAPGIKKLPQRFNYDSRYFDLVLPGVKIGPVSFTARFLMDGKSDKLTGVSLKCENAALTPQLVLAVEKQLTQDYGAPASRMNQTKLVIAWSFPTTAIEMIHADSPLAGRFLYINYSSHAPDAKKRP